MPEFLADGGEGFLRRADVAIVRIKSAFVNGKAGKQFAAVEIVLRETGEPQPRLKFVALLHEMAAFVDFSQKQADGNVLGDFAFNTPELARSLVSPYKAPHFCKNGTQPRVGFQPRLRLP